MSINMSSISHQREPQSVVNPVVASPQTSKSGKDEMPETKELSSTVDAVIDAKKEVGEVSSEQQLKPGDVDRALSNLNDYAQNLQRDINFSVDETTHQTVIQVIDSETDEVIRQIPSEDILALARTLEHYQDDSKGKLIQIQV